MRRVENFDIVRYMLLTKEKAKLIKEFKTHEKDTGSTEILLVGFEFLD